MSHRKLLSFFISLVLFILSLLFFINWQTAIGITVIVFIHEAAHILGMKINHIPTQGIRFIPFWGAQAVPLEDMSKNRAAEFSIVLLGPLAGSAFCGLFACLYLLWPNPLILAIATVGIFFNLFNLLPFFPLDGGRIVRSLTYSLHPLVGRLWFNLTILCLLTTVLFGNWIALFPAWLTYILLQEEAKNFPRQPIPWKNWLLDSLIFLLSTAAIGLLLIVTYQMLDSNLPLLKELIGLRW